MPLISSVAVRFLMPALLALPVLVCAQADPSGGATVPAVWKSQKIDFHYFGRTSRYSCDGMSDKVRTLLMQMGARRDMKLLSYGCEIGRISLRGINPGLSIEFSTPVPAAADKTPAGADSVLIDARYESFTFHQDVFRNLDIGDCELVEEFVRQVLPKFTTRGIEKNISCVPYQLQTGSYDVKGEVLRAVINREEDAKRADRRNAPGR